MIESYANGTVIVGNVIHTIHWGIQVGSDQAIVASNTITAADYGVYVLDPAQWPGVSTVGDTIFDTTYSSVANAGIRIPANFQGTVVDAGREPDPERPVHLERRHQHDDPCVGPFDLCALSGKRLGHDRSCQYVLGQRNRRREQLVHVLRERLALRDG